MKVSRFEFGYRSPMHAPLEKPTLSAERFGVVTSDSIGKSSPPSLLISREASNYFDGTTLATLAAQLF